MKSEIRNPKFDSNLEEKKIQYSQQIGFSEKREGPKLYDLENRTLQFAKDVRVFVKMLSRSIVNNEDVRQLVRSSGSVGANYIEANESLSKKDFLMRIKISRKEAKESRYWLYLIDTAGEEVREKRRKSLIQEATELMNIFGAIIRKSNDQ